jgi:hypothetical protein
LARIKGAATQLMLLNLSIEFMLSSFYEHR